MRAIALSIAVLLCALISSADPLQRKTAAAAVPCVPNTLVIVTDDVATGDCNEAGGGSADSICVCDDDGLGLAAAGGGGNAAAASEPYDCDATVLGQRYYNTVRDEVLTCADVTTAEIGPGIIDVYEWSSSNDRQYFDVRDFGAVCQFKTGDTETALNDDGPAINQAILAAGPGNQISDLAGVVIIPGHCYTRTQILWKGGTQIWGTSRNASGIWCADGMNDDCVLTGYAQRHSSTVMKNITVGKAPACTNNALLVGGPSEFRDGAPCTKGETIDTKGSGIHYIEQTADGKNMERVWSSGHPQFGIWVDQGTDGFWAEDTGLFSNGVWPGITGTETGGSTSTVINDTGKSWVPDEWKGYFADITSGGETRARVILSNTATSFTVVDLDIRDAFTEAGATYLIDRGGGLFIESTTAIGQPSGVTDKVGCNIDNVVADGNEPATLIFYGGQTENGSSCTFRNVDVEGTATSKYAVLLFEPSDSTRITDVNMRGPGSVAAIAMVGDGLPRHISYNNVNIKEAQTSYYVDMSMLDDPDMRLLLGRHRNAEWSFSNNTGSLFSGPFWQGPLTEPPYTCIQEFNGHYYYDTEDGPCFCDGDFAGSGASAVWCTFAGGPGCGATTCDNP